MLLLCAKSNILVHVVALLLTTYLMVVNVHPFTLDKVAPQDLCLFMFALCSWWRRGVKGLCFVPLGQSQRTEVMCHCHSCSEGLVHPRANLGPSQRMGKAPCSSGHLGNLCAEISFHSPGIPYGNWAGVPLWGMADVSLS